MNYKPVINFCPTGMVPQKTDNPHVPISAAEIIEDVHRAWELGITIAHLHARETNGDPAWSPEAHIPILEGVKKHCPGLLICFSTSGRNVKDFERRSAVIELKPDMCSLTLGSLNFLKQSSENAPEMIIALFEKMMQHKVLPEFECFSLGMVNFGNYLKKKYNISGVSYWNILFGNIFTAQADLIEMGAVLNKVSKDDIVGVAGLGQYQLTANSIALANGYGVRIGLEDNIYFDRNRTKPAHNFELVKRVHELIQIYELEWMKPDEFRSHTGAMNCSV